MRRVAPFCVLSLVAVRLFAQEVTLTLGQAVDRSIASYGAVRVSQENLEAAAAGINLARTAYLPKVDGLAQVNRATRNNIYGMLFPQTVIPPISGPPHPDSSGTNVWGTAAGFLVSWEPFDFGVRKAGVDVADASRRRAESAVERTRLEVSSQAAGAFLTILAAQQAAASARAGVERATVLDRVVSALVNAELRPGADGSRSRAELIQAQVQVIQAEQAVNVARAALGQLLNLPPSSLGVVAGRLLDPAPAAEAPAAPPATHPLLKEQAAAIDEVTAREKVLDRSYFPKFNLQGATYSRGSGANPDFSTGGGASGLGPNVYNWGLGFSVTFPILEYASLRARKQIEEAHRKGEAARLAQDRQDLTGQLEEAKAELEGARRIAAAIPAQLEAARQSEQQATARYRAGLGTLVEVAEAERFLTQTEIDESLARLRVWRAMLAVSVAQGDLQPFLDQVGRP